MNQPECPICLQPYDPTTTIPRVLPCGHTICEPCLTLLHLHSSSSSLSPPNTLQCPTCTHLISFSSPSSLPKNFDLLHFSPSFISSPPQPRPRPKPRPPFPPPAPLFFPDHLGSFWKDFILPHDAVLYPDRVNNTGRIKLKSVERFVGLFELGCFTLDDDDDDDDDDDECVVFQCSYMSKVMRVLSDCMSDDLRGELSFVFRVCERKVCRVLGLWLDDVGTGCLYLVSERMGVDDCGLVGLWEGIQDLRTVLGTVGVELCEVLIGLQKEGFVLGCLGLSCFRVDEFGHVYVDLSEVLAKGRVFRERFVGGLNDCREMGTDEGLVGCLSELDVFVSPEVLVRLVCREKGIEMEKNEGSCTVCYSSDVWLLACLLLRLVVGNEFVEEMWTGLTGFICAMIEGSSECDLMYLQWKGAVTSRLETLMGSDLARLEIFVNCLDLDPECRPRVTNVWEIMRRLNDTNHLISGSTSLSKMFRNADMGKCLLLGELCNTSRNRTSELIVSELDEGCNDGELDSSHTAKVSLDRLTKGLAAGKMRCKDLQGHRDCITGFCVGGGFLFSSSFDKTVSIWSLQDFTHVHTFSGHEHRVMAVVFVDQEKPLCISADSGGGIFCWEVVQPFGQEPLKKWYEEKDWRYSGIHALAVSDSHCLYTGSGDRLIKAWSLRDHTLLCTLEGHKSVVSTLALFNGVLYSGSWDGTVRLWSLHDHSPLAVFGEDMPGTVSSVLALHAAENMVVGAYEKGHIKIWVNDMLRASKQVHDGAVFALAMEGGWLFSGGWDKAVKVQEVRGAGSGMDVREFGSFACDSVIKALMYEQEMLFVGYANRLIKVYHCGS